MMHFQAKPIAAALVADAARRLAAGDPSVEERFADDPSAAPCRLTLADPPRGARMLLFRHRPFGIDNPYAEEGPVFAWADGAEAQLAIDEVPNFVPRRPLILVRRYNAKSEIAGAELVPGVQCGAEIKRALALADTDFVHVRSAAYGCFLFRADRAA